MKKTVFLWYLLIVGVIVIAFDMIYSFVLEKTMDDSYTTKIHKIKEGDSQIAIIGASRASHHYIPALLDSALNKSTFNYGIDGRNIFVHYVILESLINEAKKKPEIVVLDLNETDVYDMPQWNNEKLNILYPYYYSNPAARETINELLEKKELFWLKNSGLVRHNSEIINDIKSKFNSGVDISNGYEPLFKTWNENIKSQGGKKVLLNPEKIKYIKKFIDKCKEENIDLIIAVSPNYAITSDLEWLSVLKNISEEKNVTFFNAYEDKLFINHPEWFNDPAHLNDVGARNYTELIIRLLKDREL